MEVYSSPEDPLAPGGYIPDAHTREKWSNIFELRWHVRDPFSFLFVYMSYVKFCPFSLPLSFLLKALKCFSLANFSILTHNNVKRNETHKQAKYRRSCGMKTTRKWKKLQQKNGIKRYITGVFITSFVFSANQKKKKRKTVEKRAFHIFHLIDVIIYHSNEVHRYDSA